MHCILKKKYINRYTTKINNFLFFLLFFMWVFYFSNAWGRNFAIYLRRKTPIKHMNLRHVNIVSQSYIGNTALRYTSKQVWAAQGQDARPVPPPPGHGAPGSNLAASHRDGDWQWCWGFRKELRSTKSAQKKGCFVRFCLWREERRNTAGEWACLLHQATLFRKESHIVMVLPKTTEKQTHENAPPVKPLKNPQTWH